MGQRASRKARVCIWLRQRASLGTWSPSVTSPDVFSSSSEAVTQVERWFVRTSSSRQAVKQWHWAGAQLYSRRVSRASQDVSRASPESRLVCLPVLSASNLVCPVFSVLKLQNCLPASSRAHWEMLDDWTLLCLLHVLKHTLCSLCLNTLVLLPRGGVLEHQGYE